MAPKALAAGARILGYMTTDSEGGRVQNRGLLTEDDRAFYRGEKTVESSEKNEKINREKRYNIRQRKENIAKDIDILLEAGEEDLVNEFYADIGRYERLEQEIQELRNHIDK